MTIARTPIIASIRRLVAPPPPAPLYIEHDLPTVWLDAVDPINKPGEVRPRFMLRLTPRQKHSEIPVDVWAWCAAQVGAVFFSIFSQDAKQPGWDGGMDGWPLKGTNEYATGQLAGLAPARALLRASGISLAAVRCLFDIESKHRQMVPLGVKIARELGFSIGPGRDRWAANFGSSPVTGLAGAWFNDPAPDGLTTGIITYQASGNEDRNPQEVRREIAAAKKVAGGRFAVWYRTTSKWAQAQLPAWRADPACVAAVGWTPN